MVLKMPREVIDAPDREPDTLEFRGRESALPRNEGAAPFLTGDM